MASIPVARRRIGAEPQPSLSRPTTGHRHEDKALNLFLNDVASHISLCRCFDTFSSFLHADGFKRLACLLRRLPRGEKCLQERQRKRHKSEGLERGSSRGINSAGLAEGRSLISGPSVAGSHRLAPRCAA